MNKSKETDEVAVERSVGFDTLGRVLSLHMDRLVSILLFYLFVFVHFYFGFFVILCNTK